MEIRFKVLNIRGMWSINGDILSEIMQISSQCDKYFVALQHNIKLDKCKIDRMKLSETVIDLNKQLEGYRDKGNTVGFVPTMGALHNGHAELVKQSVLDNDVTVVSVFVNPTQFNNQDDLKLYPRTPEKDYALLNSLGVDIVFAPSVEEIYPEPDLRVFDFGDLDKVMEGKFRSGHFNGVAQVVSKLFSVINPKRAYFGEKDFQQLAIVREMVKQLQFPIEIIGVQIVREDNGLAMSSRNQRLTNDEREIASSIYKTLYNSLSIASSSSPRDIENYVIDKINSISKLHVEYFSIVDGDSLKSISSWDDSENIIGCIAAFCGEVRLIDNIRYK